MNQLRIRLAIVVPVLLAMAVGLGSAGSAAGQGAASTAGPQQTQQPQVLVLDLYFQDRAERDRLAQEWGAEEANTRGGYLTVWADQATYDSMRAQGLQVTVDEATTRLVNQPRPTGPNPPNTFYGGFRTVEEMQAFLDQEVAAHPTLAQKIGVGPTWCKAHPGTCVHPEPNNGYTQYVLHITNQAIPGPKPVFWYEAGIHAREIAVPEIAMNYISWLLDNYNTDADAHWLVDWHDIWVLPMVNPDGHHIVESGGGGNNPYYQRKNGNDSNGCGVWPPNEGYQYGTDNNRNFPFHWNCCGGSDSNACGQTYHGTGPASDAETANVVNMVRTLIPDQRGPNLTDAAPLTTTGVFQDMHSDASLNLSPWGFQPGGPPNGSDLVNIGQHMSAGNAYPSGNGYPSCAIDDCLYTVDGGSIDWAYGELGAASLSTEVGGNDFFVPLSYVENTLWPANRGPLIYEAKIARLPYLETRGPDAALVAASPMTVTQGTPAQLNATINYAWSGNAYAQNVAAAEYYVDTPPWAGGTALPLTGSFTSQTVPVQAAVVTASLAPGRHILFVRGRGVSDYGGFHSWGPITAAFLDVLPAGGGTPTPSATVPAPTATSTAPPSATAQPSATATAQPSATAMPSATLMASATAKPSVTAGASPTARPSATATQMASPMPQVSETPTTVPSPTAAGTGTATPAASATPCTLSFRDVTSADYFYTAVGYLACHGVISGYADGTFRPYHFTTRAQMVKIVVLGLKVAGFTPGGGNYTFADVPPANPFWPYVEAAAHAGIVAGYTCGHPPAGGCDEQHRSFFLPYTYVTRGQLAKIVVVAAGWPLVTPTRATFTDVPPGSPFYSYVETAACHGVVSGYADGTFRPANNAVRGQIAKIVYQAVTNPGSCAVPNPVR